MSRSAAFARLALALLVLAFLLLASLHVLKADYDIRSYMISHYAVGKYGWVMKLTFFCWSAGILALTTSLLLSERSSWHRKAGAALLLVVSAGLVVSGIYNTVLPGMPDTPEGDIHDTSFLVNVVSMGTAIALAVLVVLGFVLQFATLHKGMPYGITNRIFVITLLAWMIALAVRLASLPTQQAQPA